MRGACCKKLDALEQKLIRLEIFRWTDTNLFADLALKTERTVPAPAP